MTDGLELYQELTALLDDLDRSVAEAAPLGRKLASDEREYKVAAAVRALELRESGRPATLIDTLVKGDPDVSLKRFRRDCSEADYQANREAINALKLRIRIVNDQVSREWGRA